MKILISIEANEIEHVPERSLPDNVFWKMTKSNDLGFTHFVECERGDLEKTYILGKLVNDCFIGMFYGYGKEIPTENLGVGNVFTDIRI